MTKERLLTISLAGALAVSLSAHASQHEAPETVGERLRRECTSIVKEADAGQRRLDDEELLEYEVADCIMQRGRTGE